MLLKSHLLRIAITVMALVCMPIRAVETDIRRDAAVDVIERVIPAVVNISSKTVIQRKGYVYDWWRDNWSPFSQDLPPEYSAGSGVIIDEEGYVLTNAHVIEQASEVTVKLHDNRTLRADLVVGTRQTDVALLKLRGKPGEKFPYARLGADDDLFLGETVLAVGNPFGLGESVSKGILSSKSRRAKSGNGPLDLEDWLQTDAAINPGNSGGPLVNLRGEVIGLNVAVYKEGQGIGFAIPVKRISESLAEIYTPEVVKALWFGATFQSHHAEIVVATVETGSPADKGGLRPGDIVIRVNNKPPRSTMALNRELIAATDKQDVSFTVQRGTERRTLSVRLLPEVSYFNAGLIRDKIGAVVDVLNPEIAVRLGLENGGFAITSVDRGSPAAEAGIQRGFILEGIDGQALDSITSAARILAKHKKGTIAKLQVVAPRPPRRGTVEVSVR
jgi:serine protease Do